MLITSEATLQVDQATIHIDFACAPEQLSGNDLTLLGTWSFLVEEIEEVVPQDWQHYYVELKGERVGRTLWDEVDDAIEDDEPWVEVRDADSCIMIIALLGKAGGEYRLRYQSEGSPFWAFHDLSHVRRDTWFQEGGGGLHPVDNEGEDRAHTEGAFEALASGVTSLAEVARALAVSEPSFLQRFGVMSKALDHITARFTLGSESTGG